jgi:hypothetical protein
MQIKMKMQMSMKIQMQVKNKMIRKDKNENAIANQAKEKTAIGS